jgi:hypothetical protein
MVEMMRAALSFAAAAAAFGLVTATTLGAQTQPKAKPAAQAKAWTPGQKTPDGQPDIQGIWANNNITPMERPQAWEGKATLTDQELADVRRAVSEIVSNDGDAQFGDSLVLAALQKMKNPTSTDRATGNYNQFWLVDRDFVDNRTSLVTDPPDGKIPAMTPEAIKAAADRRDYAQAHPADGPEDRSHSERCVNFGWPKVFAGYNSYYQVIQGPGYAVIVSEMAHDARIIPIDSRPHVSKGVEQWNGDARGHWEGATLVVDTTNFSPKSMAFAFGGPQGKLHLTEKFTRVKENQLNYEVTINDPATDARPFTVMVPLQSKTEQIFEYACHEGNEGMFGTLSGHRANEREEAAKVKKGSN